MPLYTHPQVAPKEPVVTVEITTLESGGQSVLLSEELMSLPPGKHSLYLAPTPQSAPKEPVTRSNVVVHSRDPDGKLRQVRVINAARGEDGVIGVLVDYAAPKEGWRDAKDAARYRYIRGQRHADIAWCYLLPAHITLPKGDATAEQLDAAIDAALSPDLGTGERRG
jgi:hypothetical protein